MAKWLVDEKEFDDLSVHSKEEYSSKKSRLKNRLGQVRHSVELWVGVGALILVLLALFPVVPILIASVVLVPLIYCVLKEYGYEDAMAELKSNRRRWQKR